MVAHIDGRRFVAVDNRKGLSSRETLFRYFVCDGVVTRSAEHLLTLDFEWNWLSGDKSGGTSRYLELRAGLER